MSAEVWVTLLDDLMATISSHDDDGDVLLIDAMRDNALRLPTPDRLALARALVADMPGVMVAKVPDAWLVPAEKNTPYNKGRRRGWNDFRTELISAGSATHQPKEPTDAG